MNPDRIDLSEWVIHFVHDRDLNHYPKDVNLPLPFCFDRLGKPLIHALDKIAYEDQLAYENSLDHPYGLEADASAYSVLTLKSFSHITPKTPSNEVLEKVKQALKEAQKEAEKAAQKDREIAPRNKDGYIADICGFATVVTSEANTEITDALIGLDYASPCDGECYFIFEVTSGIDTEQALRVAEVAAQAAAKKLSELLGQRFSVHSTWD
ncbi:MAG: hypothetical protein QNJ18_19630 [Xenococcaceae cyanobacterium MO_167.B52]|nr:hypothetical protein [Xenococcaceae cyanobacterium MO_167.B52]